MRGNSNELWDSRIKKASSWSPHLLRIRSMAHFSRPRLALSGEQPIDCRGGTARQLFLQASGHLIMHGWNHESFTQAGELLKKSAALDPGFALAPTLHSMLYGFGARIGLATSPEVAKAEAQRTAERALALESMDSTVLGLGPMRCFGNDPRGMESSFAGDSIPHRFPFVCPVTRWRFSEAMREHDSFRAFGRSLGHRALVRVPLVYFLLFRALRRSR